MNNSVDKPAARRLREQNILVLAPLTYRLRKGFMAPEDAITEEDLVFEKSCGFEPTPQELRFPVIFHRGIECGDGWLAIVQDLSEKIERELLDMVASAVPVAKLPGIVQVKEKYGGLSVGIRGFKGVGIPDAVRAIIEDAENKAAVTCELCGAPGTLIKTGYMSVLCKDCGGTTQLARST
jgi:hypothetical protein